MDLLLGMQLYLQVLRTGSFSAAGREAGVSPATVFRRVNALEAALGSRLLHRSSRKLTPTEAGELYARRAEQVLADIREINADVADMQAAPRGLLRVQCRVSLGAQHLAPAVPGFLRRYPDLRLDLRLSDRPADLVADDIDVAIIVGRLRDESLIARKLATSDRLVCASPDYLRRRPAPLRPQDLDGHNCLLFRADAAAPVWRFHRGRAVEQVHVSGSLQSDNAEAVRLAAIEGLGVALLPEWSIGPDLARGTLVALMQDYQASPFSFDNGIYAVTHRSRQRSVKVRLFLDFLVALFKARRGWRTG